jgi:photosystem II stability/assembly factor-like uncharacterized protein
MRSGALIFCALALAGCRFGAPYVVCAVDQASGPPVTQLHVSATFTPTGGSAQTDNFELPSAPSAPLKLPTHFTVQLPSNATGALAVTVRGLAAGQPVASGSGRTDVAGNGQYTIAIVLAAGAPTDGGAADLPPSDLASPPTVWVAQSLPAATPALLNVWGSNANDVYAVGYGETILHTSNHGATWTRIWPPASSTNVLTNVWGADSSSIVAVGLPQTLLYRSGGQWLPGTLPAITSSLLSVWGASAADVYAVGTGGVILHSTDRQNWSQLFSGMYPNDLFSVWGTGTSDVFIVGTSGLIVHKSASGWSSKNAANAPSLTNIWGTGSDNSFAVGLGSVILHTTDDGANWSPLSTGGPSLPFDGNWAVGDDVLVISGDDFFQNGSIWHSPDRGAHWQQEDTPGGSGAALYGIWGAAADDVYAVGGSSRTAGLIYHRQPR